MTTAKAIMINTAHQWNPVGASADLTRVRQGWGRPDLQNLYNLRDKMFVINETDLLTNLGSRSYSLTVPAGSTTPFKATLDYADPMGNPASSQHRINDLTLKVTSPSNVVYFGNNGLSGTGQWSTSGGVANTIDTVENVFVQSPEAGTWTVEVIGSQIVQDSHTETPAMDADFALVVTGVNRPVTNRTPFDFDGDGKADVSVFRPSTGNWHILESSNNSLRSAQFGLGTDRIVPADYDGDGKTDVAVYRAGSASAWYIFRSSNSTVLTVQWGTTGDLPAAGDFNGDGQADIAVFRPGAGVWYIATGSGSALLTQAFGTNGDVPVVGDYEGDGRSDIAVFRPSTGVWYASLSSGGVLSVPFGASGDLPVAAKFDTDSRTDFAVFRPSTGTWYVGRSADNTVLTQPWGISGDRPVAADYDGDGKADIAVFRPSDNNWYILQSGNNSVRIQPWGASGDLAVPSAYVP